jgi:hypothetical protein
MKIKTLEQAHRFVIQKRICTLKSLSDSVDLPDKQPGETGWGQTITAVWSWKNQLPAHYPKEIFYGKTKGGAAVLMTLDYLRNPGEIVDGEPSRKRAFIPLIRP